MNDMSPENRATVERYLDGFRRSDRPQVLACLTDDVEWEIPGLFHVRGIGEFEQHIVDDGFVGRPAIDVTRLTEAGDMVIVEGTVRTKRTGGGFLDLAFCDLFELRGGRIRRLVSYLMQLKGAAASHD